MIKQHGLDPIIQPSDVSETLPFPMEPQIAVMYLGNVVEVLPGGQLSKDAVHPYTRALMGSVFDINMDFSKPIENLEGEAPSPLELPEGCPFQGRCTKCMAICKKEAPQMVSLTPDHQVACHLYTKNMQK